MGFNNGDPGLDTPQADDLNFNTVSDVEGYERYSQGFSVSANKDGCFPFVNKDGETQYFDISLSDLRRAPALSYGNF